MTLTDYNTAMRQCLIDVDVGLMRKLTATVFPQFPAPGTDAEVEGSIHYARTVAESIPFRYRAYSHAWLCERALPSGLPDDLRPKAERMYPRIVDAVGVAVLATGSTSEEKRQLGGLVRDAMNEVVMDHYSSDRAREPERIKRDMLRRRTEFWKRLFERSVSGWRE